MNYFLNIFFTMLILLISSCSFLDSDYSKLMNPILKIKEAEKKAHKPNPVYDGFTEPDFPDFFKNNETLEGVDANHDGVRDDIEIWINRTAKDEYLRMAMKNYYISVMRSDDINSNDKTTTEDKVQATEKTMIGLSCYRVLIERHDPKLSTRKEIGFFLDNIFTLIYNTSPRDTRRRKAFKHEPNTSYKTISNQSNQFYIKQYCGENIYKKLYMNKI